MSAGLASLLFVSSYAYPWGNGGYSRSDKPRIGTHDYIASKALSFVPKKDIGWLYDHKDDFLFGTEAPDNEEIALRYLGTKSGYGDQLNHHVFFRSNGSIDDVAAERAQDEYYLALAAYKGGNFRLAAFHLGCMTHYISDCGVWAHVMGTCSRFGAENQEAHRRFERVVDKAFMPKYKEKLARYGISLDKILEHYIVFDGELRRVTPYEATIELARAVSFGDGKILCCTDMNDFFSNNNLGLVQILASGGDFRKYVRSSFAAVNRCVNSVADVLYTFVIDARRLDELGVSSSEHNKVSKKEESFVGNQNNGSFGFAPLLSAVLFFAVLGIGLYVLGRR